MFSQNSNQAETGDPTVASRTGIFPQSFPVVASEQYSDANRGINLEKLKRMYDVLVEQLNVLDGERMEPGLRPIMESLDKACDFLQEEIEKRESRNQLLAEERSGGVANVVQQRETQNVYTVESPFGDVSGGQIPMQKGGEERRRFRRNVAFAEQGRDFGSSSSTPVVVDNGVRGWSQAEAQVPQIIVRTAPPECKSSFTGSSSAKLFVSELEEYFSMNEIPERSKFMIAVSRLCGQAKRWYTYVGSRQVHVGDWLSLRRCLLKAYPSILNRATAEQSLYGQFQGSNDEPTDFVFKKLELIEQLLGKIPDEEIMSIIVPRLNTVLQDYIELREPRTVNELCQLVGKFTSRNSQRRFESRNGFYGEQRNNGGHFVQSNQRTYRNNYANYSQDTANIHGGAVRQFPRGHQDNYTSVNQGAVNIHGGERQQYQQREGTRYVTSSQRVASIHGGEGQLGNRDAALNSHVTA